MSKLHRFVVAFTPFIVALWLFVAPPYDPYASRALQALVVAGLIASFVFAVAFLLTARNQRPARALAISLLSGVAVGAAGVVTLILLVRG